MARKRPQVGQWIALLATVFVVGGVVAIMQTRPGAEEQPEGIEAAGDALDGRIVVFADEGSVHLIDAESGVEIRECDAAGVTRIEEVTPEGIVIGMPSGERVRLGFDCVAQNEVLPAAVRVLEADEEGVSRAQFADGATVPLVASNGRPYREPQLVGWLDASRAVFVSFRGDIRTAVVVGTDGSVEALASLPEIVSGFSTGGGAFWYVSASPGPGIEFGPQGPSAIHRVRAAGDDVVVAQDAERVVEAFLVNPSGTYAYVVGGMLFMGQEESSLPVGTAGVPIGWSDDGRILVLDGQGAISLVSVGGVREETAAVLPPGVSIAWSAHVVH